MQIRIARIVPLVGLAALLAGPAIAQFPAPPMPRLEVHITNERPPAPRHERRGHRPGPDYVWVAGFHDWQDGQWVWTPGRWELPHENASWIAPRYVHESGYYRYEPGHWSNERLEEGADYREWHAKHHSDRDHDRNRDHDRDHDRDRDHERDHN